MTSPEDLDAITKAAFVTSRARLPMGECQRLAEERRLQDEEQDARCRAAFEAVQPWLLVIAAFAFGMVGYLIAAGK